MSLSLLVHSSGPWSPSSYSVLVSRSLPQMVRDGHKITLSTFYGLQGQPLPWQIQPKDGKPGGRVNVLPGLDPAHYDVQTILPTYRQIKADALITICDVWVFDPQYTSGTVFAPWLPIDMNPVPAPVLRCLEPAVYPMVYSKWGVEMLEQSNIKAHYVPGSAPADIFKPGDKQEARQALGFPPDADFIASMVAANKDPYDRKGFAEALAGFAKFAQDHPHAYLYLHTNWGGAIDIASLVIRAGLKERVIRVDDYGYNMGLLGDDYMVKVYQASDVLLNPAKSEGFGLPLIESQLCGTPIAATDFSTTDELLFGGWKIGGQLDWSNGLNSWRLRCYIDSVAGALTEAYANRDNDKLRQNARNGAMRFDTEAVFNRYWKPALKDIEAIVNRASVAMPKIHTNGKAEPIAEQVLA